jgi:hypothetical protein
MATAAPGFGCRRRCCTVCCPGSDRQKPSDDIWLTIFYVARRTRLEAGGEKMLLHRIYFY